MPAKPPTNATPIEIRKKAIAELRRRQAAGETCGGIGKDFGVSDPSVYSWALQERKAAKAAAAVEATAAPPLRERNTPGRRGRRISDATKAAALAEIYNLPSGGSLQPIADKYKVTAKALRQWRARSREAAPVQSETAVPNYQPHIRQNWPLEFRQRVVEAFVTRPQGTGAREIAERFGVPENFVFRWRAQLRNGEIRAAQPAQKAAQPDAMQLAMRDVMQPIDGQQLDVSISSGPVSGLGLLQLRNIQLEAENKRLRKIVTMLLEAAT